ncbi:MAG: hypothetical protein Q4D92_07555, partial [Slackia sp.]|nr:hypothetical protein [Slackia sp.]
AFGRWGVSADVVLTCMALLGKSGGYRYAFCKACCMCAAGLLRPAWKNECAEAVLLGASRHAACDD